MNTPVRNCPLHYRVCVQKYLPSVCTLKYGDGNGIVINNGVTGMPNFSGARLGTATCKSTSPRPPALTLDGTHINGIFAEANKLHHDHRAFVAQFESDWNFDSPAKVSYSCRIDHGPEFSQGQALGTPFRQRIKRRAS